MASSGEAHSSMATTAVVPVHDSASGAPRLCGALKRDGETMCRRPAGWGTEHAGWGRCKLHGGSSPSGTHAAQRAAAGHAVATFGLPQEIDPHDALYDELARTNGHVQWLAELIANLERGDLKQYGISEGALYERPSVWLEIYARERRHLASVAKACVDVGVEGRRMRLAEEDAAVIAEVIRNVLTTFGVGDRPDVGSVVRSELTAVVDARAGRQGGR